jgi:hypothetical protein
VPYSTADARQQLLDSVAEASVALGEALASLSEAYEQLDEASGDRVEERLFRPVQRAYGRARSASAAFAERHALESREIGQARQPSPSHGVKGLIETAESQVQHADTALATLQDSLLPVEVGDAELRRELGEVRELIAGFTRHARDLLQTVGR